MYTEDRIELKRRAKGIMSSSKPSPVSVGVVYLLVTGVFSLLSTRLLGANLSENDVAQIMNHMNSGNYEYAMLYMQDFMPPTPAISTISSSTGPSPPSRTTRCFPRPLKARRSTAWT